MSTYWPPQPASDNVIRAGLRVISADHYERDGDPHADAEAEHAAEQLALAARELVRAVDARPEDEQPIGWRTEQPDQPTTVAIAEMIRSLIPGGRLPDMTVTVTEKMPDGGENSWTGTAEGLAQRLAWPQMEG